jgi:ribonucleoside-triphosphate reductase
MDMAMKLCRNTQIGYFAFTRDITVSLRQFHEMREEKNPIASWERADKPIPV